METLKKVLFIPLYLFVYLPIMFFIAWMVSKPLDWLNDPRWTYTIYEFVLVFAFCGVAYHIEERKKRKEREMEQELAQVAEYFFEKGNKAGYSKGYEDGYYDGYNAFYDVEEEQE